MTGTRERRLHAEWTSLLALADANPTRITGVDWDDTEMTVQLAGTPALALSTDRRVTDHTVVLRFGELFPAVPMELYLEQPVQHPNLHPVTGFVCLWERHRVAHSVVQALHKLTAILGWQIANPDALHVMQPESLRRYLADAATIRRSLFCEPLVSSRLPASHPLEAAALPAPLPRTRTRLS